MEPNVDVETTKETVRFIRDIADDIVRPSAKAIGKNIGLLVDGVMGWLGLWGEKQKLKQEINLAEFKEKIATKISHIEKSNLVEPKIKIVGPAVEASKFYIEEKYCRDMFSQLIASACDRKLEDKIHPVFPEIIKQLTHLDARFILYLSEKQTTPVCKVVSVNSEKIVTPYRNMLFDLDRKNFSLEEQMKLTVTVDNLQRLGLIMLNGGILEYGYDYEKFKSHWLYQQWENKYGHEGNMELHKYRIELTELGYDFVDCCVRD